MSLVYRWLVTITMALATMAPGLAEEFSFEAETVFALGASDFARGRLPTGARPEEGDWRANSSTKSLDALPLPLGEAWLEIGPEFVRGSLRVRAEATALPGKPIESRYGVGLFGDKGYQAMLVPAHQKVQLLYRGEPLAEATFAQQPGATFQIELTALYLEEQVYLQVRVLELKDEDDGESDDEKEESQPAIVHLDPHDRREMPLAGSACLIAVPFSGKPVQFSAVVLEKLTVSEGE